MNYKSKEEVSNVFDSMLDKEIELTESITLNGNVFLKKGTVLEAVSQPEKKANTK